MSMTTDIVALLNSEGNSMVTQVRANMQSTSTNATNRTQQSLQSNVTIDGQTIRLQITGKKYFMVVETGRKPTPDKKPSKDMVTAIYEWMQVVGLEGEAYGIAMGIQKHGSKLWQKGGRKDIVSNVIDETMISRVSQEILDLITDEVVKEFAKLEVKTS